MLLHEWDLAGAGRHSLTDIYVCLQLLNLVRVPAGALSGQGAAHSSGLMLPERPDSCQSNATTSSLTTSTSAAGKQTAGTAPQLPAATAQSHQKKAAQRGAIGAAWEGLQGGGGAAGGGGGSKGGLSLKEAYLKERVAALEAELTHARSGSGAVNSKEVSMGDVMGMIQWQALCVPLALCKHSRLGAPRPAGSDAGPWASSGQAVARPRVLTAVLCCWMSVMCRLISCVLRWRGTRRAWQSLRMTSSAWMWWQTQRWVGMRVAHSQQRVHLSGP